MGTEDQQGIGTLNEKHLHAELKKWYALPGDRLEVPVDGYVIDIVRDGHLVEIQTGPVYPIRDKLRALVEGHPVRLVCPLASEKWLVKMPPEGEGEPERRRSPKHCTVMNVFSELIRIPRLLAHPNFSLHVLLTRTEEVRVHRPGRARHRRGWVIQGRRLLEVVDSHLFQTPAGMADLVPEGIEQPFTTADLAREGHIRRSLAQQACYCLRKMGTIRQTGKRGRAYLYRCA